MSELSLASGSTFLQFYAMNASVLAIGDELVLGQTIDTNSAWLSARLASMGVSTVQQLTIADEQDEIRRAIIAASDRSDIVLISGGLGPTEDDLTRQALADALAVDLVLDQSALRTIKGFFDARHHPMPSRNKSQAMHPIGSIMIENACGTAPGIKCTLNDATIYAIPGVPTEMRQMYERSIAPDLRAHSRHGVILLRKLNTFGIGESTIAKKLGSLMERKCNPKVGTTVSKGIVSVRIRSEFPTQADAQAHLDQTVEQIEQRLGASLFGSEDQTLQDSVMVLLKATNQTISTAESCTGGLLGKLLTDVSGASDHYIGGWVCYSNAMKLSQLGVPMQVIQTHGAVSKAVASALALGALERSGSDLALGVTGIAGPTGGSDEKPVGMVWIALAARRLNPRPSALQRSASTDCLVSILKGNRITVRDRAAKCALQMVRLYLKNESYELLQWARPAIEPPKTQNDSI